MVDIATTLEDQEEKSQFIMLVASRMKKSYLQWNKEVDDHKIFFDLYELSDHKIDLRNSNIQLPDLKEITNFKKQNNNKNQKKNKQQS